MIFLGIDDHIVHLPKKFQNFFDIFKIFYNFFKTSWIGPILGWLWKSQLSQLSNFTMGKKISLCISIIDLGGEHCLLRITVTYVNWQIHRYIMKNF